VSSRTSEMCKMDDEDDIIKIWEISDKRLSWSPFKSAFLISNFNHGAAMHVVVSPVGTSPDFIFLNKIDHNNSEKT
jgi:hypothetical protein